MDDHRSNETSSNPDFKSRKETDLQYSFLTARNAGLVDVKLQRLYRFFNSAIGDHMDGLYGDPIQNYGTGIPSWYILPMGTAYSSSSNPKKELHFLWNPNTGDHMASPSATEGTQVGYSW